MKTLFYVGLFLVLTIIAALLFGKFVPYNMDEFSLYHTLACHFYPNNMANIFRVGCTEFDLKLPFTQSFLPLREYTYMGSFTSFYFAPVFILWRSPEAVRFMGLVFLGLEALLLTKLFKLSFKYIFLGLVLFFPYFFQHIVDTGVVGFQITLFLASYLLLKNWLTTQKFSYLLLSFFLIFLGEWTKLTFIWFIPALLVLTIFEARGRKNNYLTLGRQILIGTLLIGSLTLFLFMSQDINGKPFIAEFSADSRTRVSSFKDFFIAFRPDWFFASPVVKAVLNPFEATQRIYDPISLPLFSLVYGIFVFFLMPILWLRHRNLKSIVFYLLFLVTLLFIYRSGRSWSIHHAILGYPLLIMSFLAVSKLLSRRIFFFLAAIFIVLNAYLFLTFPKQPIPLSNDFSAQELNHFLNNPKLANDHIYVIVDWGMYYYQSLYGPKNQTVLYVEPLTTKDQIADIKKIAASKAKKVIFIYNSAKPGSSMDLITNAFNLKLLKTGKVWQALIQK